MAPLAEAPLEEAVTAASAYVVPPTKITSSVKGRARLFSVRNVIVWVSRKISAGKEGLPTSFAAAVGLPECPGIVTALRNSRAGVGEDSAGGRERRRKTLPLMVLRAGILFHRRRRPVAWRALPH
ncbi:hypothetical protein D3C76_1363910 [compost metagenome]